MSDTYTRKGVIIVSVSDGMRVALSLRGLSWPSGARAMASHRSWTDLCRGDCSGSCATRRREERL
jgi:hypothetical protein